MKVPSLQRLWPPVGELQWLGGGLGVWPPADNWTRVSIGRLLFRGCSLMD